MKVDPITFAVIKSGLDSIADDMAYTVVRIARSEIVKDVTQSSQKVFGRGRAGPDDDLLGETNVLYIEAQRFDADSGQYVLDSLFGTLAGRLGFNDYEVRMGTFRGATIPHIDHFREFPDAVQRLPEELKDRPLVMFCTGGIRCEKAGPFMELAGFKHVHQLDGGILKYFEECGGAHFDGECFVFDRRVGVDPALRETKSVLCFNCQMPLTEAEQRDPRYVPDISCPHCHVAP